MSAPNCSAISQAMVSICSGPMSLAGVLTMSRARAQAWTMARASSPLAPWGSTRRAGAFLGGLVAVVAIGPQAPGGGDIGGVEPLGRGLQAVIAGRQAAGGGAEAVGPGLGAEAQQHAGELAVRTGDLERLAGLGLEPVRLGQAPGLGVQPFQHGGEAGLGHGLDRDGVFGSVEQGVGHGTGLTPDLVKAGNCGVNRPVNVCFGPIAEDMAIQEVLPSCVASARSPQPPKCSPPCWARRPWRR